MGKFYYICLQFSAIQKTINRTDRLWSIAGISRILQKINEVELPESALKRGGEIFLSGGGKFTVRFKDKDSALEFRKDAMRLIATALPMLEFQITDVISAGSFQEMIGQTDAIEELKEKKNTLRGYALTYNPHFLICEECGQYPATEKMWAKVCRICCRAKDSIFEKTRIGQENVRFQPSIDRIYQGLGIDPSDVPLEFEEMVKTSKKGEDRKDEKEARKTAIWFSDLNSMKKRVTYWLKQRDDQIYETFSKVKDTIIDIIKDALELTFRDEIERRSIPFRLIVAGGDDLCIAMERSYVVDFAINLSRQFHNRLNSLPSSDPLSEEWLRKRLQEQGKSTDNLKLSFGGAFVVTHHKTPFKRIYDLGEELMKISKIRSNRRYNCVNWKIYIGDESEESPFVFEKPLPILKIDQEDESKWSLEKYVNFIENHKKRLTFSQIYQIVQDIFRVQEDGDDLMKIFRRNYCKTSQNLYQILIDEPYFYDYEGDRLNIPKIMTLFELKRLLKDRSI